MRLSIVTHQHRSLLEFAVTLRGFGQLCHIFRCSGHRPPPHRRYLPASTQRIAHFVCRALDSGGRGEFKNDSVRMQSILVGLLRIDLKILKSGWSLSSSESANRWHGIPEIVPILGRILPASSGKKSTNPALCRNSAQYKWLYFTGQQARHSKSKLIQSPVRTR